jgi:hypothetical protein
MENEEKKMETLKKELELVNKQLNSILTLLKGHELDNEEGGMVGQVHGIDKRLVKIETFKDRVIYVAIGVSIPASWGIIDIISKVITAVR